MCYIMYSRSWTPAKIWSLLRQDETAVYPIKNYLGILKQGIALYQPRKTKSLDGQRFHPKGALMLVVPTLGVAAGFIMYKNDQECHYNNYPTGSIDTVSYFLIPGSFGNLVLALCKQEE